VNTKKLLRQSRHILAVLILIGIIALEAAYIYVSIRGEYLLRDFKIFVEQGLARALQSEVSIGDVRGGIFYPIALSDVVLYVSSKEGPRLFAVKQLSINYRLWDVFFDNRKRLFKMKLVSPQFFITTKENLEHKFDRTVGTGFSQKVCIDVVDGSVISSDTDAVIIKEAHGTGMLFGDTVQVEDMLLQVYGMPLHVDGTIDNLYSNLPRFDLDVAYQNHYAEFTAHAQGHLNALETSGTVHVADAAAFEVSGRGGFRENAFTFAEVTVGDSIAIEEGRIDFDAKEFQVAITAQEGSSGTIALQGDFASWPEFRLQSDVKHWVFGGMDVSTMFDVAVNLKQRADIPVVTGSFDTNNTILNYKPCGELSMQFTVRKKAIEILGLKWGRTFRMVGKVELEPPYRIELIALLDGTKLEELAHYVGGGIQNAVAGSIKGRFELEGPLANPASTGHITASDGKLGDIFYDNAVIHLVGKGPMVTVGDSRIYKEIGYLIVSGEIDFRKLGKRNVFEDIVVKSDDQTIVWEGWDITKGATDDELTLNKRINEELEVGIKASLDAKDKLSGDQASNTGEVEFKYRIRDNESLKLQLKDEEEFFGIEHKVRF
jgi:hypothetical protein